MWIWTLYLFSDHLNSASSSSSLYYIYTQVKDVVSVVLVRILPPLCLAALSTITLTQYIGWSAQYALSLVSPLLLFSLSPISIQSKQFAHEFRLNESLVMASWRSSCWVSLYMLLLIATVSVVAGMSGDVMIFVYALCGLIVGLLGWGRVQVNKSGGSENEKKKGRRSGGSGGGGERPPAGKVRMVYAGVPNSSSSSSDIVDGLGNDDVVIDGSSSSGGGIDDKKEQPGPSAALGHRRSVFPTKVCRPIYGRVRGIRRGVQPLKCRF